MTMKCSEVRKLIPFYVDHELGPEEMREVEEHVAECGSCAAYLKEELELKDMLASLGDATLPASLEERVFDSLEKEDRRRVWRRTGAVLAVVGVAALAFVWGVREGTAGKVKLPPSLMEDLVVEHECPAPSDPVPSKNPKDIAEWTGKQTGLYVEPYVPASWGSLEGARVTRFKGRRAVQFSYRYKGRRVTLMVFDPSLMSEVPRLDSVKQLRESANDFLVRTPGGRHVVLFRRGSLGYSVISDLNRDDTIEFVSHLLDSHHSHTLP